MPLYEFLCQKCGHEFEQLELRIPKEAPVAQCPVCKGAALQLMSIPADNALREPFDCTAREKLPNWHKNQKAAFVQEAWQRYRQKNPIPGDKGPECKIYNTDGLKKDF